MSTKIAITILGFILVGICLPLYKAIDRSARGFVAYVIWCAVCLALWMFIVFGTNGIC